MSDIQNLTTTPSISPSSLHQEQNIATTPIQLISGPSTPNVELATEHPSTEAKHHWNCFKV